MSEKERAKFLDELEKIQRGHLKEIAELTRQNAALQHPRVPWRTITVGMVLLALVLCSSFLVFEFTKPMHTVQNDLVAFFTLQSDEDMDLLEDCIKLVHAHIDSDLQPFYVAECFKQEDVRQTQYLEILDRLQEIPLGPSE